MILNTILEIPCPSCNAPMKFRTVDLIRGHQCTNCQEVLSFGSEEAQSQAMAALEQLEEARLSTAHNQ